MSKTLQSWLGALALGFAALAGVPSARADIVVNVDQAAVAPFPIAIPTFGGLPVGAQISGVITADLERSGLFRPLDPASFRAAPPGVMDKPANFDAWKGIGAQALLVGSVSSGPDGRLSVDFRLWDTYAGEEVGFPPNNSGLRLTATPDSWRTIAHQIADKVYEKLTGEPGYFDTRVVFVAESGPKNHKVTRLAIMDQDGANPSYLTDGSAMVFAPRFSSRRQEITYMVVRPTGSSIYLKNLDTGREELLGHVPANMTMTMAPRFSPDDGKVAFSAEVNGASNIYVMTLANQSLKRLTDSIAIDTSPAFSPDGGQIVFNSDRGGAPQLYVMNADGSNVHRISFGSGRYTAPTWSPDGKLIAFVKQQGQDFSIGVMAPDGSGERILTTSYFADEPTWAPNGRVIMFERKLADGASRLWTVDVTGHIQKEAPYPVSGSDPAWSPLLH